MNNNAEQEKDKSMEQKTVPMGYTNGGYYTDAQVKKLVEVWLFISKHGLHQNYGPVANLYSQGATIFIDLESEERLISLCELVIRIGEDREFQGWSGVPGPEIRWIKEGFNEAIPKP